MAAELDLRSPRHVHVVGIGGAGMSAIATVLARMGHTVSGSDLKESRALARLRAAGVDARVGHAADQVPLGVDAVVVSTAIPPTNPEVVEATRRGVPVHRRAEALRALVATRRGIAVAGSHGKTTTSSMLALVLRGAGWQPTFLIGGDVNEVGTNAAYDVGEWLVVEADESDGTFLELAAEAAIITNVEADHLDHYGSLDALIGAFEQFLSSVPGPRVVCADEPNAGVQSLVLGMVFVLLATMFNGSYSLMASSMRHLLLRGRTLTIMRRWVSGGMFIGLGVMAAATGHRTTS